MLRWCRKLNRSIHVRELLSYPRGHLHLQSSQGLTKRERVTKRRINDEAKEEVANASGTGVLLRTREFKELFWEQSKFKRISSAMGTTIRAKKNPFVPVPPSPAVRLLSPVSVWILIGVALSAWPANQTAFDPAIHRLQTLSPRLKAVPDITYVILVVLAVGYFTVRGLNWLRRKLLKRLFAYQGWLFQPKCWKTSVGSRNLDIICVWI